MERAWKWNELLTPRGKKLRDESFKNVNFRDYHITITETNGENDGTRWNCSVGYRNNLEKLCYFEQNPHYPSLYGGCECRAPEVDGIPCHHMIAVVKSGQIEGLTVDNAMPEWWTTEVWRQQYPKNSGVSCDFDIHSLKNNHPAGTNLRYCPNLAAAKKSGRPKSNKRKKSFLEEMKNKNSKKK
jgi:hypothetical protein